MQVRYEAALHPVLPADGGGGDYLTDGAVYEVIEVYTGPSHTSFRISCGDGTPALFDARGFKTFDDTIPADWRVAVTDTGSRSAQQTSSPAASGRDFFDSSEGALLSTNAAIRLSLGGALRP